MTDVRSFPELVEAAVEANAIRLRRSAHSKPEIIDLLQLARQNHRRAAALRDDRGLAYSLLYLSFLNLADALTAACGYAATGEGGHTDALDVGRAFIRRHHPELADRYAHVSNTLRRKRHEAVYQHVGAVSEDDLEFAEALALDLLPILARGVDAIASLALPDGELDFDRAVE